MHLEGVLTVNNKGNSRWPANPISHPLLAPYIPASTLKESPNYRSRFSNIQEEHSHQVSLMAGAYALGPSDAPCMVETSTAHGELLLLVSFSFNRESKLLWFCYCASNLDTPLQPPPFRSSEMLKQPQNILASLSGRRTQIPTLPTKANLGFPLVGLSTFGPLRCMQPIYKRCDLAHFQQIFRSGPNSSLPNLSHSLCCFMEPVVRKHQLRHNQPSILGCHKNILRTLPLESPRDFIHEIKSLKEIGIMIPSPRSGDYRGFLNFCYLFPLNSELKQTILINAYKGWIFQAYKPLVNLKEDLEPLPNALKRIPSSFRTIAILLLVDEQIHLALLVPAKLSTMETSSTSHSLLTVTIASSIASFVDDLSTNRVITCAKSLSSLCLQALMDLSSKFSSYPCVTIAFIFVWCLYFVLSLVTLVILAIRNLV